MGVSFIYWNGIPSFFNCVTCILIILSLDNVRLFQTYYDSPDPTSATNPSWSQQYGAFEVCRTYSTISAPVGSCSMQSAGECDFHVFNPVVAAVVTYSISPCSGWNAYRAFSIISIICSGLSAIILSYFGLARISSPDATPLWYSMVACGLSLFSGISGMISMAILLGVFISSGDSLLWGFDLMVAGWVLAFIAGLINLALVMRERRFGGPIGQRETGSPAVIVSSAPASADSAAKATIAVIADAPSAPPAAGLSTPAAAPADNAATHSKLDPSHLGPLPTVPAHRKSNASNAPSLNASPSQTPGVMIHNDWENQREGEAELQPYEPQAHSDDKVSDDKV